MSTSEGKSLILKAEEDEGRRGNPSLVIEDHRGTLLIASALAKEAAKIVRENGLSRKFGTGPREHVYVEGWLTISRVQNEEPHAKVEEVLRNPETGHETIKARGWLTDRHGRVVSEADGYCSTEEANWNGKPFYARASMAQTRAIAKAMRLRHAWVMVMAGYAPTPAEEIEALEEPVSSVVASKARPVGAPGAPPGGAPAQKSHQESSAEDKALAEMGVVEGETIQLEAHGCKSCAVNQFLIKRAGPKAKRPGALYLECYGCKDFGGYAADVMKKYQPAEGGAK